MGYEKDLVAHMRGLNFKFRLVFEFFSNLGRFGLNKFPNLHLSQISGADPFDNHCALLHCNG
jgi:hypothetical protein